MHPSTDITRTAWRHDVPTRSIPEHALRQPVQRAWQRFLRDGAPQRAPVQRVPLVPASDAVLAKRRPLIDAAQPYVSALSRAAAGDRHAVMLADGDAVLLHVACDDASLRTGPRVPAGIAVACGAPLDGIDRTDAVGADARAGRWAPERPIAAFPAFTSLALRGPAGETAGALILTMDRADAASDMRGMLVAAAHGIEAELLRRRMDGELQRLREQPADLPLLEALLLEGLSHDVVHMHTEGRRWLERAVQGPRRGGEPAAIAVAERLIERFRNKARIWHALVSEHVEPRRVVDLRVQAEGIATLLRREASLRGVGIEVRGAERVAVCESPELLQRALLRGFVQALDAMPEHATLVAELDVDERADLARVRFPIAPDATVAAARSAATAPCHPERATSRGRGSDGA